MKQVFNILLLLFIANLIACGDDDSTISDNPNQEETTDPTREPQDTIPDILQIDCANHAPQLYLSVTDQNDLPILDSIHGDTGTAKEGHIAIRKVTYTGYGTDHTFKLTYEEDNVISIYPETIHTLLDRFEETGDSIRFYGKRPLSGIADSIVIPVRELWLPLVIEWTNDNTDTLLLRYNDACDIQLTQIRLQGDSIGHNSATLVKFLNP